MTTEEIQLNPQQQRLVDETDGIYVVDAGAGTGKTHTITHRYASIVEQPDVEPGDVLLVTFTRNAAEEMRRRIVRESSYSVRELKDAPINNFHGVANQLLNEHGHRTPEYLGIDTVLTSSTSVLENNTIEKQRFRSFYREFRERNDGYRELIQLIDDPSELLDLINNLASKGVIPTQDGWYQNGEQYIQGDWEEFKELFKELNEPTEGVHSPNQSKLKGDLSDYGDKLYTDDAPRCADVRGDEKSIPEHWAEEVFEEDREDLKAFLHDVYFGYLEYALQRNYLNFGFLQMLAYVLLCEDDALRRRVEYPYVMIDEFQDTSEIQFKLALLLAGDSNICAVGDWKQSIYSFQHADVENITDFESRIQRYKQELNRSGRRVTYEVSDVEKLELETSYRSTQPILEFADEGLLAEGSKREDLDEQAIRDEIVELTADTSQQDHSSIEAIAAPDDEEEAVLAKIQEIVEDPGYMVRDENDELRKPTYGDVAVFTRTRSWGRELLNTAAEYGVPVAFEGGIELYRTDQAKTVLAWLRIVDGEAERGWPVVLEELGYSLGEIEEALEQEEYPSDAVEFRDRLREVESVPAVVRRVLDRYGYNGGVADALLEEVESIRDQTEYTLGELAEYMADAVDDGTTVEVETDAGGDSVTVQTIHAAKGLEYPIVLLANVNERQFPSSGGGGGGALKYSDTYGVRQKKIYDDADGDPYIYTNWRYDVLRHVNRKSHDEERRLLYVALTRARDHLLLSAEQGRESEFLENLPVDVEEYVGEPEEVDGSSTTQTEFTVPPVTPDGPRVVAASALASHDFTETDTEVDVAGRRFGGREFGNMVHQYAEDYARERDSDRTIEPPREIADSPDIVHVEELADSLTGELHVEEEVYLPLEVDGEDVLVRGVADLVEVTDSRVRVVDYKTDRTRDAVEGYEVQVGVYRRVLGEVYPDREVEAELYFTAEGESVEVGVSDLDSLRDAAASRL